MLPYALPSKAFIDSFLFAHGRGRKPALGVGDGCRVLAYDQPHAATLRATPVLLRLGALELDCPAAATWTSSLLGRLHAGHFRVSATAGSGAFSLCSPDGRALNWKSAATSWRSDFPTSLLVRGAPADAPDLARGFSCKPRRRVAMALLIECLGAYAASSIETSPESAAWQESCRPWWARALTRALAAAVLVAGFEYSFVAILPVYIERLPYKLFLTMAMLLLLPLTACFLGGVIVNSMANPSALRSSFVVWACTLAWVHAVLWPLLLLCSACLWHDIPLLQPASLDEPVLDAGVASAFDAGRKQDIWTYPQPLVVSTLPPPPSTSATNAMNTDNPWASSGNPWGHM
jgi:hypothetical protein